MPLCTACWSKIDLIAPPFCRICGRGLPAQTQDQAFLCIDCQRSSYFFQATRSVCVYDGIIKDCIHLFKYQGRLSLAGPLGALLVGFAHRYLDMKNIDLILAVPLHRRKIRQRQFNQALVLAKSLARAFGKEIDSRSLVKVKGGAAQVSLSRAERLQNVKGAFQVRYGNRLRGKNALLIDDVFTTGATVNECARMLKEAGAGSVQVLTLARSK